MPAIKEIELWPRVQNALGGVAGGGKHGHRSNALAELRPLLQPAFAYERYPVRGCCGGRMVIGGGHFLNSATLARLFAKASEVVLLAYTIGPLVEARVGEHRRAGEEGAAFALDVLGTVAVNELGQIAHGHIKGLAAAAGTKSSIPFNPGVSHWPIEDNAVVLRLIPAAEIGLRLGEGHILSPMKSVSMAIAFGEDVLTDDVASSCDYCDDPESCRGSMRRMLSMIG